MSRQPPIRYFLETTDHPFTPDSAGWQRPIPVSRNVPMGHDRPNPGFSVSYADYFTAVRHFLVEGGFRVIRSAAGQTAAFSEKSPRVDAIDIFLAKHGAFYHPARVVVRIDGHTLRFAVNVAISRAGRHLIEREFRILRQLNNRFHLDFIPTAFDLMTVDVQKGFPIAMFMANWLEGYREFHLSVDPGDHRKKLKLWDPENGDVYLTPSQSRGVYRQVAMILTYYYNVETFEQVFSWHHAAGDFVIGPAKGKRSMDVRLITVRAYAPLFENLAFTPEDLPETLLLFLLNLSIRTRLDRMDGVGEMTWSAALAVPATVEGFFNGLDLKELNGELPSGFTAAFKTWLTGYPKGELYRLAGDLLSGIPARSPDLPIIRRHLKRHIGSLRDCLASVKAEHSGTPAATT